MPVETSNEVPFGHLAREMSRFLDRMTKNYSNFYPGEAWQPAVNLYETETTYLVCVDLSGVDKERVDLHLVDNRLILHGRRDVPRCPADILDCAGPATRAKIHLMEIDHGPFHREVELPADIENDKIKAAYHTGLLWIEIPKK
jgi:HSP20 family protein